MKITNEEIEYIIETLNLEIVTWEDHCKYVEYEMTEKNYLVSKMLVEKLKKFLGKGLSK